jgi:hypothetical protein
VEPWKRDRAGNSILNSSILSLAYLIEEAPDQSLVAGAEHRGILVPELQRYRLDIQASQWLANRIDLKGLIFYQGGDPLKEITVDEAVEGDTFQFTLIRGTTDTIPYYPDADYYDLSEFIIETGAQLPKDHYNFTYEFTYYHRVVTEFDELYCIDDSDIRTGRHGILHQHPGDAHYRMVKSTPAMYFDQSIALEDNEMVKFLRPWADLLQDVTDEQTLIENINNLHKIPAQLMPYLAYLIGVDLPYISAAGDNIRRALLERGAELLRLKGTKRVLTEMFAIFGFAIDVVNLWSSTDGNIFIAPGEQLPDNYENEEITVVEKCHVEPLFQANQDGDFGAFEVPLLYRPLGNITLYGFRASGTDQLEDVVDAFDASTTAYDQDTCGETQQGFIQPSEFLAAASGSYLSTSTLLLDFQSGKVIASTHQGEEVLSEVSCSYDPVTNVATVYFDHWYPAQKDYFYCYATYRRQALIVPNRLTDYEANRFDIQITSFEGEVPDSDLLDYLLDAVFRYKPFHSLLRKIAFTIDLADVYQVTDFCVGGQVRQEPGLAAGELQVPPPVAPSESIGAEELCTLDRGFKEDDLALQSSVLEGLEEEFEAWKALEDHLITDPTLYNRLTAISPPTESLDETESDCQYNPRGQDRSQKVDEECNTLEDGRDGISPQCGIFPSGGILPGGDIRQEKENTDPRRTICDISKNVLDYCYRARVKNILDPDFIIQLTDMFRCNPCTTMLGRSVFWLDALPESVKRKITTLAHPIARAREETARDGLTLFKSDCTYVPSNPENMPLVFPASRVSAYIEKDNLFLPGHRPPTMGNLAVNFVSSSWDMKPWDYDMTCDGFPDPLNAHLETGSDGIERILFDSVPYTIAANGIESDIGTWGSHTGSPVSANKVTHAIYTTAEESPYVTLEGTVYTEEDGLDTENEIFPSWNGTCENDKDYIDGHPAVTGLYDDFPEGYCHDRPDYLCQVAEVGLGLPEYGGAGSGTELSLLFKCGSGIRVEKTESIHHFWRGIRLDCGCL